MLSHFEGGILIVQLQSWTHFKTLKGASPFVTKLSYFLLTYALSILHIFNINFTRKLVDVAAPTLSRVCLSEIKIGISTYF